MLDKHLQNLLAASAVAIFDRMSEVTEAITGLNRSDTAALLMVAQWPGGTLQSFAGALGLSQPATVRLVDRLEQAKLIERRSADSGHALGLYPSSHGRKMAERAIAARDSALELLFSELDKHHVSALKSFAETVLRKATRSATDGDRICRLCCETACPDEKCPVWHEQRKDPTYRWRGWK